MKYAWTLAICLAVLCLAAPSEAAPQKTLRDAHVDLACADCHIGQKNPKQAGAISCAKCHDASEVAKQTASRGKKNPHISPHWGTEGSLLGLPQGTRRRSELLPHLPYVVMRGLIILYTET